MATITTTTANGFVNVQALKHQLEDTVSCTIHSITPTTSGGDVIVVLDIAPGDVAAATTKIQQHVGNDPDNELLTSGLVTLGNVDIKQNFTVEGTQTIIHTTDLQVEDHLVVLNTNVTTPEATFSGVQVKRDTLPDSTTQSALFGYDERSGQTHDFKVGLGLDNLHAILTEVNFPDADLNVARSQIAAGVGKRILFNDPSTGRITEDANLLWDTTNIDGIGRLTFNGPTAILYTNAAGGTVRAATALRSSGLNIDVPNNRIKLYDEATILLDATASSLTLSNSTATATLEGYLAFSTSASKITFANTLDIKRGTESRILIGDTSIVTSGVTFAVKDQTNTSTYLSIGDSTSYMMSGTIYLRADNFRCQIANAGQTYLSAGYDQDITLNAPDNHNILLKINSSTKITLTETDVHIGVPVHGDLAIVQGNFIMDNNYPIQSKNFSGVVQNVLWVGTENSTWLSAPSGEVINFRISSTTISSVNSSGFNSANIYATNLRGAGDSNLWIYAGNDHQDWVFTDDGSTPNGADNFGNCLRPHNSRGVFGTSSFPLNRIYTGRLSAVGSSSQLYIHTDNDTVAPFLFYAEGGKHYLRQNLLDRGVSGSSECNVRLGSSSFPFEQLHIGDVIIYTDLPGEGDPPGATDYRGITIYSDAGDREYRIVVNNNGHLAIAKWKTDAWHRVFVIDPTNGPGYSGRVRIPADWEFTKDLTNFP
jgi:hypothetical protein